ncbi:MAG: DUF423 domain-containing protein [Planctomycetaceae bacterium]|jgi:uncharacterized membrane protein YgdD (TMEM256/DUF423 family)|nr:DUF423 domain-containing protein [Planctomycetaceae bacterium]
MSRLFLTAGGLLGGLAVAAGAFGAHGLKAFLEAHGQAANWETAARYALVHALATVAVGTLAAVRPAPGLAAAGGCFLVGTAIFSGCLFALALSGVKILGAVVPIGGVLLIAGWMLLAYAGWHVTA